MASLPYFNGTGSVYACIRKSTWARASLFRRFTDTNVHENGYVKIRKKNSPQNIRRYMDIFTVYTLSVEFKIAESWTVYCGTMIRLQYGSEVW